MHGSRMMMLLVMSVLIGACQKKDIPETSQDIVLQAKPVVILLQATKAGDLELLKTAFSVQMRTKLDKDGWDELLKTYQDSFSQEFGEYKIDEFTFKFTGSETEGQVSVIHNEKELPGLYVIREEAGWTLNES